jgi:hypothetical protein
LAFPSVGLIVALSLIGVFVLAPLVLFIAKTAERRREAVALIRAREKDERDQRRRRVDSSVVELQDLPPAQRRRRSKILAGLWNPLDALFARGGTDAQREGSRHDAPPGHGVARQPTADAVDPAKAHAVLGLGSAAGGHRQRQSGVPHPLELDGEVDRRGSVQTGFDDGGRWSGGQLHPPVPAWMEGEDADAGPASPRRRVREAGDR